MARQLAFLVLLALATPAFAQNSNDPLQFAKGPAQWIMTAEEKREWRSVKTAQQAQDFIDLFWARRDPTPGTLTNENRDEFVQRVAYADKNFREGNDRGSLTERGRVMVTLGFATSLGDEAAKTAKQATLNYDASKDVSGGRQLAGRSIWTWDYADAQKFDMPKIEVVFIFDKSNGGARRDPLRPDFVTAMPVAIKKMITNPGLTSVPEWARAPKSDSQMVLTIETENEGPRGGKTVTTRTILDARKEVAKPKGAGKLTLVKDAFAIDTQIATDPFAKLASKESFTPADELGFVAEYCAGAISEQLAGVTMRAKITGEGNGQRVNLNGEAEEVVPDSIKASPGCHMVRGAVPLTDLAPGSYTLTVTLASASGSYDLTRDFRIE